MSEPQSFKSHARFDPPYHFFLAIIVIANLIIAIIHAVHHFRFYPVWLVVLSLLRSLQCSGSASIRSRCRTA